MQQFGNIYICDGDGQWPGAINNPALKDNYVFVCSIVLNPERAWGNRRMIRHSHTRNQKLIDFQLLTDKFFTRYEDQPTKYAYSLILIAIPENVDAQNLFKQAKEMRLVDIYLYRNGKLIDKYD